MRNTLVAGCLALTALASCAVMEPAGRPAPKEKQIDVNVSPEFGWFGGKPVITVNQETATVRAGTGAVVWSLGSAAADDGYRFGDDGISFEFPARKPLGQECSSTPNPDDAFDRADCRKEANGRLFVCPRKKGVHVKGACYKYTVRLIAGTVPVDPKDPWIANE